MRRSNVVDANYKRRIVFNKNTPIAFQTQLLETVASYLLSAAKRSAGGQLYKPKEGDAYKIGEKELTITKDDIKQLLKSQDGKCALTNVQLALIPQTLLNQSKRALKLGLITEEEYNTRPSLDRIDNSKGYIPGNIQITTISANLGKNGTTNTDKIVTRTNYKEYIINTLIDKKDINSIKELWSMLD